MTWLANVALWLLALLPLSLLRSMAGAFGWLAVTFNTAPAKVTRANLAHCYPDMNKAERKALARESLSHTSMLALEAGKLWRWPLARCLSLARQEHGRAELAAALSSEEPGAEPGVLMLVPHLGNWEFFSPWLAQFGMTALYEPPKIKALDTIVRNARERAGIHMAPTNRAGLKTLYSVLRGRMPERSKLALILPDQVPARSAGTVEAPFFAQPALTMTLVHRLLKQTGARVFIGAALRIDGGFRVEVRPLDLAEHLQTELDTATAMNSAVESFVALAPEQYQWEYKRLSERQLHHCFTQKSRMVNPMRDPLGGRDPGAMKSCRNAST